MLQDHLDDKFYSHIPIHDKGISMTNHIAGLKPSKDNKNLGVIKHIKSHDVVQLHLTDLEHVLGLLEQQDRVVLEDVPIKWYPT